MCARHRCRILVRIPKRYFEARVSIRQLWPVLHPVQFVLTFIMSKPVKQRKPAPQQRSLPVARAEEHRRELAPAPLVTTLHLSEHGAGRAATTFNYHLIDATSTFGNLGIHAHLSIHILPTVDQYKVLSPPPRGLHNATLTQVVRDNIQSPDRP